MIKNQTNKTYNVPSSVEKTNKKTHNQQLYKLLQLGEHRGYCFIFIFPIFMFGVLVKWLGGELENITVLLWSLNWKHWTQMFKFKFVPVLKPVFLSNLLCRVLSEHKWSRKQKQQNRSWTRLCWCVYLPVHTKICIALKIWSVSSARALHIPINKSNWSLLQTAHMLCFECQGTY